MRKWKPVKRRCRNCGTLVVGYRDIKGRATAVCPRCGATAISWPLNRRCERCDIYAPPVIGHILRSVGSNAGNVKLRQADHLIRWFCLSGLFSSRKILKKVERKFYNVQVFCTLSL